MYILLCSDWSGKLLPDTSQIIYHHNSGECLYLSNIIDNNTNNLSDKLGIWLIKSLNFRNIIVTHKSMQKPNTTFPSGGKAVKRLFWFVISNARIIPFFRCS